MTPTALPSGFWWCLVGFVACGALGLLALWFLLRRFRVARALSLHHDRQGTTIVEFPFALIVLVLMSLLTWQLGFLVSAYILVDYAAFAAARVAIVQIPPHVSDEEPAHVVRDISMGSSESDKGDEIQEAAAFVCYPMSDAWTYDDGGESQNPILQNVRMLPGAETFIDSLNVTVFAKRFAYARQNTSARLVVEGKDAGAHSFAGGSLVTVEVTHDYSLRIAIAARVFAARREAWGYVTPVKGRATLLYEGFGELVPATLRPERSPDGRTASPRPKTGAAGEEASRPPEVCTATSARRSCRSSSSSESPSSRASSW